MANIENTLFEYCRRNNVEGLKTLFIRLDIDINAKDNGGCTSLHHAACFNSKECLELLLGAGAYPNVKNCIGHSPLHYVANHNSKDCLQLLLEAGADINEKDNKGNTPLYYAAIHNSKECLQLLLEGGADPTIKNNRGHTPLEFIRDANFRKEMEGYANALSTFNIKEPSC